MLPINSRPGDQIMLEEPTDILCSYFYFSDVDMGKIHDWGTRIVGDSGAFSALTSGTPVDREKFHAWAHKWSDALFWVASLDVIGDQAATRANYLAAVRDEVPRAVPTIHYGEPPETMDWYVDRGVGFFGLGGMVPYSSEKNRLMRWLIPFFRRVRDNYPHVRFHGWGVSHPAIVDNLPWWSTDSSGFSSAFRFGSLRLFDPRAGRFFQVDLDGRSLARHRALLRRYYGLNDWRAAAVSTPATRRDVGRVAIKAIQLYSDWLRARQRVTPPAILGGASGAGPRVVPSPGSDLVPIDPGVGAARGGPLQPVSMGGAQMQPIKSLNPEDGRPLLNKETGPRNIVVGGKATAPQLTCLAPEAGPLQSLSAGASFSSQMQVLDPSNSTRRTKEKEL